uniref:Uncharacterized protein n=1 Tax=Avena sativa TaxID=4498 RepID=A0ACD6A558_AVESA
MFATYGLSMSSLRGQGYDGDSNMRGEFHGLERLILEENPYAHYIHCFAHRLQLVIVAVAKCCSLAREIFNTVAWLSTLLMLHVKDTINWPKRSMMKLCASWRRGNFLVGRKKIN